MKLLYPDNDFKMPSIESTAKLSEALKISASDPIRFYRRLSSAVGDFEAEFLLKESNTALNLIYVEISENFSVWLGKTCFMQFQSLHEAVWAFFMLHHVFLVFSKLILFKYL